MRQGPDSSAVNGPHSERRLTDHARIGCVDGGSVDDGIRSDVKAGTLAVT